MAVCELLAVWLGVRLADDVRVGVGDASLHSSTLSTASALMSRVSPLPWATANVSRTWPYSVTMPSAPRQGVWLENWLTSAVPVVKSTARAPSEPSSRLSTYTVAGSVRSRDSCVSNRASNDTRVGVCA